MTAPGKGLGGRGHRDAPAVLAYALVQDLALNQGEERVVAGFGHTDPRPDVAAALADDESTVGRSEAGSA